MSNPEMGGKMETVNDIARREAPSTVANVMKEVGCTPEEISSLLPQIVEDFKTWIPQLEKEEYETKIKELVEKYKGQE